MMRERERERETASLLITGPSWSKVGPVNIFSIIEKQIKMWLLTTTRLSLMVQACLPHCVMTICSMQYAKNLSACVHA
jgi:hypothetical protein